MEQDKQQETRPRSLLEAWLKTASDFWGATVQSWSVVSGGSGDNEPGAEKKAGKPRFQESWETGLKGFQALSAAMSEPEALEGMLKGINTFPDIVLKMIQPAWDSMFYLQKEWMERAGRIGKSTAAYNFENLDQEAFRAWREIYEKEFRQFLQIP
ncbi:MAG: hypothetical protein FJY85_20870, partial [Deltaproteobacteria bacterium]|nr:hypothetical protein [Deltaproteobacteria bacterium]